MVHFVVCKRIFTDWNRFLSAVHWNEWQGWTWIETRKSWANVLSFNVMPAKNNINIMVTSTAWWKLFDIFFAALIRALCLWVLAPSYDLGVSSSVLWPLTWPTWFRPSDRVFPFFFFCPSSFVLFLFFYFFVYFAFYLCLHETTSLIFLINL